MAPSTRITFVCSRQPPLHQLLWSLLRGKIKMRHEREQVQELPQCQASSGKMGKSSGNMRGWNSGNIITSAT